MSNHNKPIAVAVLARTFPNIVQTYVLNHIISLIDTGIDTTVIAEAKPKQKDINPRVVDYKLTDKTIYARTKLSSLFGELLSVPVTNRRYRSSIRKLIFSDIWKRFGFKYAIRSLVRVRVLACKRIDLIHSHSLFTSYNFSFLREYLAVPLVTTYHGMVPRGVERPDKDKLRQVLEKSDAFVVNTKFAKSELIELGCSPGKIHIVPQGTNTKDFVFHEKSIDSASVIRLLTVARLSIEKGHEVAIHALAILVGQFPGIEYHIVGDGPEKTNLTRLVEELGLQANVFMHGFLTGDELLEQFRSAHIFILPSINLRDGYLVETQGVVLQEAQALGLPVIASRTGGIPDVLSHNKTGLLYAERDSQDLAKNISNLIQDPALYQKLCLAGRKDVEERFDVNVVCNQLIVIYQLVIDSYRH